MRKRITTLLGMLAMLMLVSVPLQAQTPKDLGKVYKEMTKSPLTPPDLNTLTQVDRSKHPYYVTAAQQRRSFVETPLYRPQNHLRKADPRAAGYAPVAWAVSDGEGWGKYSMYSFPLTGTPLSFDTIRANFVDNLPNGGAVIYDDVYRQVNYTYYDFGGGDTYVSGWYNSYNITDWSDVGHSLFHDLTVTAACTAYDPVDKKVYGFFNNADASALEFGTVDYDAMQRTTIASEDTLLLSIAANKNGQLFAVTAGGNFVQINKSTGALNVKGATGVTPLQNTQSMAFDYKTGVLYWAAYYTDADGSSKSSIFQINTSTGEATKLFDVPYNREILYLYIPAPPAEDGAPDQVNDLALDFTAPSLTGHVKFTIPTKTFSQETLTGDVTYYIVCNDEVLKQGTAQPGDAIDEQVTVKNGTQKIIVYTENNAGKSVETSAEQWFGYDIPDAIPSVVMTADTATNTTFVHWTPSQRGIHDEYLVPSELTYDVVRMPDSVVVAKNITDTTFTETVPVRGIKAYFYQVQPINGGQRGTTTISNHATLGTSFEVPFVEDFLDQDAFNLWTALNNDNDSDYWGNPNTWKWGDLYNGYSYDNHGQAQISGHDTGDGDDDDWLVSPNISLESGFTYDFGFKERSYSNDLSKLEVYIGQGDDPTTYTQKLFASDSLQDNSGSWNGYNFYWHRNKITVPADGKYHIAFHTTHAGFYLQIDSVSLDMAQGAAAPDSVTNLAVTPNAEGDHIGTISFNAPTKGLDGSTLESLKKIVIVRQSTGLTIHTFNNPTPGELLSYNDSDAVNGLNTYTVVPYSKDGLGKSISITKFIGEDKPNYPKNVTLTDLFNGNGNLTWENPGNVGANGYFVNPDLITYNVYNTSGDTLLYHSPATQLSVSGLPQTGDQELVQYGVSANNRTGEGDIMASSVILTGTPYSLPFHESFSNGQTHYGMWWFDYGNQSNGWYLNGSLSADDDGGSVYWYDRTGAEDAYCTMSTGKINVTGATKPVLEFSYYYNGGNFKIDVTCENSTRSNTLVKEINFAQEPNPSQFGWRTVFVDLTPELAKATAANPYFVLHFTEHAISQENVMCLIDNINVRDEQADNLSVRLNAPSRLHLSDKGTVTAYVKNIGSDAANDVTVRLLASGRQVGSKKISVASHEEKTVTFDYVPLASDPETTSLEAVVDFPSDADVSDNSVKKDVRIFTTDYPTVDDLAGEQAEENVTLNWSAPSDEYTTTEDFEFYDPFTVTTTGSLGPWKTIDGDGEKTYGFDMGYAGEYDPQSFVVLNPDELGVNYDLNPGFRPFSGSQYLLCMSAYHKDDTGYGDDPLDAVKHSAQKFSNSINDDWLISPELSGKAQTIKYQFGNLFGTAMNHIEVLYSTTTQDTAAFQSVQVDSVQTQGWTEMTAQLPEGAKYFALHFTPIDKSAVSVDDIVYSPKSLTIQGYNIYRDGELIDSVGADETTYTDVLPDDGDHTYTVSVVYGTGESGLSNSVNIVVTLINAQTIGGRLQAVGGERNITITNAEGKLVEVYSVSGAQVYSGAGRQQLNVPVKRGQYIVRIGGKTFNLVVK